MIFYFEKNMNSSESEISSRLVNLNCEEFTFDSELQNFSYLVIFQFELVLVQI